MCWLELSKATSAACQLVNSSMLNGQNATTAFFSPSVELITSVSKQRIYMVLQPWDFFGRNDAKAETPILWPPYAKSWLTGKDSDAGRNWGQEEKGTTEDEMAGWHYRLDGCWVWMNSGSWWWTGRPGMLQFMGLQRVRHDWETELNWTELIVDNCSMILA